MSATGQNLPVAFIFPRERMKPELMDNASSGSVAYCQKSGWMTCEIFRCYLEHIVKHHQRQIQFEYYSMNILLILKV